MNSAPTTLRDVAAVVGMSVATVSAALNGSGRVAPATRERIAQAAAALSYSPSLVARGLQRARTDVIGVLLGRVAPAQFEIVVGIDEGARERGRQLLISTTAMVPADEARRFRDLSGGLTDAIILISPLSGPEEVNGFRDLGIPIVLANYRRAGVHAARVYGDNVHSATRLTQHLIGLGHRRIAFVTGLHESGQSDEREHGFRTAMADAGLEVEDDLVIEGDFGVESGVQAARTLLGMGRSAPTAVFAANDRVAQGVILGLQDAGSTVPGDFSVVGFDDAPTVHTEPELTTVRHAFGSIGAEAARLACELIDGDVEIRSALEEVSVEFPSELVVRASSAAPGRVRVA